MKNKAVLSNVFKWIIILLTPFFFLMLSIRVMITPLYARIEYRMPGFPEDPFGFNLSDRLKWSEPSIEYLVIAENISYLSDLKFDEGDSIFNQRELSHMQDVKVVVTGMRYALAGTALTLLIATIFLVTKGNPKTALKAYSIGSWALIGLIGGIIIFVLISFNQLFTWFHQLFFASGTWTFYTSDTLIRLFPMRFWQDAFLFVGGLSLLLAGVTIIAIRKRNRKD
jgi:integral membrane protein (TIGR01906 family)